MEQNPLPNPVLPTNPVVQQPVTPQPKHSNKKRIILMIIFLAFAVSFIAGGAFAYKQHQNNQKDVAVHKDVADKSSAPLKIVQIDEDYNTDGKYGYGPISVSVKTSEGASIFNKNYNEYGGTTVTRADKAALLIVSGDKSDNLKTTKYIIRRVDSSGQIKEAITYKPSTNRDDSGAHFPSGVIGFVGNTNDFIMYNSTTDVDNETVRVDSNGHTTSLLKSDKYSHNLPGKITPDGSKLIYQKAIGEYPAVLEGEPADPTELKNEIHSLDINTHKDEVLVGDVKSALGNVKYNQTGVTLIGLTDDNKSAIYKIGGPRNSDTTIQEQLFRLDFDSKQLIKLPVTAETNQVVTLSNSGNYAVYSGLNFIGQSGDFSKIALLNIKNGQLQYLTVPGKISNSLTPEIHESVSIDGKEKIVITSHAQEQKGNDKQNFTMLDPSTGSFEDTNIIPADYSYSRDVSKGKSCYMPEVVSLQSSLYLGSGCQLDVINPKTDKVKVLSNRASQSYFLQK
jgi:hypothetical protein